MTDINPAAGRPVWHRASIEPLATMGIPVDTKDFILVDQSDVPEGVIFEICTTAAYCSYLSRRVTHSLCTPFIYYIIDTCKKYNYLL